MFDLIIEYYIPNYIITFTHTYICILWTIWISNIDTSVDETSYHHDILPANPLGPQHALLFVALLHFGYPTANQHVIEYCKYRNM